MDCTEDFGDSDEEGGCRITDDIFIPPPPNIRSQVNKQGPRLMITKIVNINFKSYAGTVVIGPFHECFSAIVGPNGSGKSNVIDSMLFVFGYRASKIRSKKISVLIHNSNEHPDMRSCTVAVHFQKIIDKITGGYDVIPNSEFTISRTAFKDSSSYYELSGKKVQFKEIAKLLRSEGVDLDHNRFLILQGEVEQIAMMKPKAQNDNDVGMLEFLEDIIGTARYKVPLEKLFNNVEELSEKVSEKLNRMRIVEREREELREPMQEAVDYLKLENTITKLQNKLYHCKKSSTKVDLEQHQISHNEIEIDCNNLKQELVQVLEEKETVNKELKEKCKKWDSIQKKKDVATAKFDQVRKKDEALHAELVETNKRRKANMASVKTEQSNLDDLSKIPEKNTKDIEECQGLIEKTTVTCKKEQDTLDELLLSSRKKSEPLLKKRAEFEKKLISLRKDVDDAKATFNLAESELELYTSVEKTEKAKLENLEQTTQTTIDKFDNRKEQLAQLEIKIPATKASLDKAQTKLDAIKSKEIEYTGRLRGMRVQYQEQSSAMQNNKSKNRIIDALMREKAEGRLNGIFGRLGDLGAIDAKYDVAVSTACGPLDNIVVDTVNTAQACIKFLRDNDIGRATFIPLEKQQRFAAACREKIRTPENVERLFDLIKVEDERILPAFYYSLQNTLVANDLNQATRIAYGAKRWRVVALSGELIEIAGTMSGGGRSVLRGRMGQRVKRNDVTVGDVEKLKRELDEIYDECNRLKSLQPPLEEQIRTLSNALKEMVNDNNKFQIEIETLGKQIPSLKLQLKSQKDKAVKSIADPARVIQMEKALQVAKKELDKVQEISNSVETQVQNITDEIENISGGRVKEQMKKISNLTKSIEKARSEICRLEVAIKTADRNTQKTKQRIETLENDVRTCEQRIKDIQKEKTEIEDEAKGILEEIESYSEALAERDELGGSLKEKFDGLLARETKIKALKIDLDQKISASAKKLSEMTGKIEEYTIRINALKLNEIPDQPIQELHQYNEEEISALDIKTVAANLAAAKERKPTEPPNMQLIKDYLQKDQIFLSRSKEVEQVTKDRDHMRALYDKHKRKRTEEFFAGFGEITMKLKEMYQMITLGGAAELELVDSLDPFTEGIVFSVRPPKKSWKNISNLSGGEKTLSSLALVFALHHFKPTPLYFMDEIDAALDFKNVSIVGTYIKERTKNAQFIVISLRSEMFELADTLVGIYKTYNATKSATINIKKLYEKHTDVARLENRRKERAPMAKRACSQVMNVDLATTRTQMSLISPTQSKRPKSSNDELINNSLDETNSIPTTSLNPSQSPSQHLSVGPSDAKRRKLKN